MFRNLYLPLSTIVALAIFLESVALGQPVTTPIYNWSYRNHASTAQEGFLTGQAQVIEAIGQANYMNSLAAINYQEAMGKLLDNQKKYVTTYYENRIYSKELRDRYARRPPTKEQWERYVLIALPDQLTTQEYDRMSGRITWPHILRGAEYAAFRDRIDELMLARTIGNDGDGSPFQREVASLIDAMKILLKSNIRTVTDSQYANAQAFLRSLDYEVKLQSGAAVPAVNAPAAADSVEPATQAANKS